MPATPTSSSRSSMHGEIKARWRIATDPRRTADQYAVWLHQLLELEGFSRERRRRRDHRHRRSARAAQSRGAFARNTSGQDPLDRGAGQGRVAARSSTSTSRRTSAPTARSTPSPRMRNIRATCIVIDFGTATTFDVVECHGRLQGRDHRAGHQPVARCAGQRRRQAPAHRDRSAGGQISVIGRTTAEPDADRHLLGLCRDDRRADRAHQARARPPGQRSSPPAALRRCSTSTPKLFDAIEPDLTIQGLSLLYDMATRGAK